MRLSKDFAMWFPVPGDPDNAEFQFRILTPGEKVKVQESMADVSFRISPSEKGEANFEQQGKPTTRKGQELEFIFATKSWKNVFDEKQVAMKPTSASKTRILNEIQFLYVDEENQDAEPVVRTVYDFYLDCREKLETAYAQSLKDQEKNL